MVSAFGEQLRLYRSRHVIAVTLAPQTPDDPHSEERVCAIDLIRVLPRGGRRSHLWRHDPDAIRRLVEDAANEAAAASISPGSAFDTLHRVAIRAGYEAVDSGWRLLPGPRNLPGAAAVTRNSHSIRVLAETPDIACVLLATIIEKSLEPTGV